jgi:hypothetical protein
MLESGLTYALLSGNRGIGREPGKDLAWCDLDRHYSWAIFWFLLNVRLTFQGLRSLGRERKAWV